MSALTPGIRNRFGAIRPWDDGKWWWPRGDQSDICDHCCEVRASRIVPHLTLAHILMGCLHPMPRHSRTGWKMLLTVSVVLSPQFLISDHRIPPDYLSHIRFAVFGCGNSLYGQHFNRFAKKLDNSFRYVASCYPSKFSRQKTRSDSLGSCRFGWRWWEINPVVWFLVFLSPSCHKAR